MNKEEYKIDGDENFGEIKLDPFGEVVKSVLNEIPEDFKLQENSPLELPEGFSLDSEVYCMKCNDKKTYPMREAKVETITYRNEESDPKEFDIDFVVCKNYKECNGSFLYIRSVDDQGLNF